MKKDWVKPIYEFYQNLLSRKFAFFAVSTYAWIKGLAGMDVNTWVVCACIYIVGSGADKIIEKLASKKIG